MNPDPTRFILLNPSLPANVGAAARAINVMGFHDLVLVAPRLPDVLAHPDALAMASSAAGVLANARVVPTLAQALDGVSYACATAMTPRDFGPPTQAPRDHLPSLAASRHRVAMVFGSERFGMRNDEVYQCHVCLCIPTHAAYGSLNLAQAVQLVAYEWRLACGGFDAPARASDPALADGAAVAGVVAHWQQALEHTGYLDPAMPGKLMPRFQQWLQRAHPTQDEVHIARGIARAVLKLKR